MVRVRGTTYPFFWLATTVLVMLVALASRIPAAHPSPVQGFKLIPELKIPDVLNIIQDDQGFLWFGNDNGLYRYDGYQIQWYGFSPNAPNSLPTSVVSRIVMVNSGELWIRSGLSGINRFNLLTGEISHFSHQPGNDSTIASNRLFSIFKGQSGTLWFLTATGINRLVETIDSNGTPITFFEFVGEAIPLPLDSLLTPRWGEILQNDNVFPAYFYGDNRVYFLHPIQEKIYYLQYPPFLKKHRIYFTSYFKPAGQPELWLGLSNGDLLKVNYHQGKWELLPFHQWTGLNQPVLPNFIWVDKEQNLWVFTRYQGIFILDKNYRIIQRFYDDLTPHPSIHGKRILTYFVDRAGILWVATDKGINKLILQKPLFKHVRPFTDVAENAPINNCTALCVDSTNHLWISADQRLHRMNIATGEFEYDIHKGWLQQGFPANVIIKTLFTDSRGNIWLGLNHRYVFRYTPEYQTLTRFELPGGNFKLVRSFAEDPRGYIWVGVDFPDGGIFRIHPVTHEITELSPRTPTSPVPTSDQVWRLLIDARGYLWVTYWGHGVDLHIPSIRTFINYQYQRSNPHSISSNYVTSIAQTSDNTIWLGTWDGGLNKVILPDTPPLKETDGSWQYPIVFQRYTETEGFARGNQAGGMLVDGNDNIWIITRQGLSRFNPRKETFKHFTIEDGIQSNQFNVNACARSPQGLLFFGGTNGFNIVHEDSFYVNPHVPPVVITGLFIQGEPVQLDTLFPYKKHVTIPYNAKVFSIEFSALDFQAPTNNQFQYYLEGFESHWMNSGTRRYAIYTNLDPGDYIFHVRASNNDGVWNPQGTRLMITITPPWYRTWWAYTLYLIIGIALSSGVRWLISNRKRLLYLRGRKISHYKLIGELGSGGMSTVYKALDLNTQKVVALKVLHERLLQDPENRQRFTQEGRVLQGLSHPNIVKVLEIGETEAHGYIVMEYLSGGTLKHYLDTHHPIPLATIHQWAQQLLEGLFVIHQQGIIHRDLTLSNIMLDEQHTVRIMDFGLSRAQLMGTISHTGGVRGTLGYVAPEQITGVQVDHRADIFAVGVILYELVTHHMPFSGDNEMAIIHALFNVQPPPPSIYRPDCPAEWDTLILKCLAKLPDHRFPNAATLLHQLRQLPV